MINPTVSIVMITYGHENYIIDALKGALMQKYNGSVELIIANDNSPDQSDKIINDFLINNPAPDNFIIKYTKHTTNKGAIPNFTWALQQAAGKYTAICEGDDYWTDPLKLQKQVDFLEKNPDYIMCFHKVKILTVTGELVDDFITKIPDNYELRKTLVENSNYIHTPSVVYRNILNDEYLSLEFNNSPIGDYFLYLILTLHGKIGYIEETMAVYRYGVGVFSSLNNFKQLKANILLFTNLYAYEKDPITKAIFYDRILYAISQIEKQYQKNATLLETRRHKVIEKIYNKLKK